MNHKQEEILKLKEEKNAIILAHNYQTQEIQEIADFLGDSLELCIKASQIEDADLVVFCGVDFMAETAAILNPSKKILIPDPQAECPMAHMLPAEDVIKYKKRYPQAAVVLYVNTLAEAKAEADILCTSANAAQVVESLDEDQILFGPDMNLASFVQKRTDKEIIPIPEVGYCYVHKMFNTGDVTFSRENYPDAEVLVHPECDAEVQEAADQILSTGGMLRHVAASSNKSFLIGTEVDMVTRLRRENPDKLIYPLLDEAICETMKRHTLDKVKNSLMEEKFQVKVPEDIADKARSAVERMLEVS
ncbi:quinolinate synthase NadA [Methanobacterium formicicum]|uniref:Quinolinate synthase n=1 Tax=Methanobacterium formicicum (strain DSM 3637 / PP1) TaxID=1204725 RepID=K2QBW2_METFP|nr:quinolinate synthase NadA [Methanobacterium formicicum]EKF85436.1 quinolinate synthetase [Methanobacterium formicicum DSM 3637]